MSTIKFLLKLAIIAPIPASKTNTTHNHHHHHHHHHHVPEGLGVFPVP